jgi:predicted transcriptional regulator
MVTTITFPDVLHESLKRVATEEHRSVNATVVVAVTQYVGSHDKRAIVRVMAAEIARKHRGLLDRLAQ